MKRFSLLIIIYLLLPTIGNSQSTFEGGISSDWTDGNNWTPIGVPASGTEIIIQATGGNNPIIPAGTYSYSKIRIKNGYELTIDTGAEVTVALETWCFGILSINGSLFGAGSLKNGSAFSHITGIINITSNSTVNITGGIHNYYGTISSNSPTSLNSISFQNYAGGTSILTNTICNVSTNFASDGIFNLKELSKMTIDGNFDNKGTFTLESTTSSTSSLKIDGTATNTGTLNIQRYLHDDGSGNGKWQLVSSPVSAEESGIFTGHFLNKYSEASGEFEGLYSKVEPLVVGEGYISKLDFNNSDGDGVSDKPNPIVFSNSTLNTNDITITLGITDDEDGTLSNTYFDLPIGFHLVGNPYTSNINWDDIYNNGSNGSNITKFLYYYVDDGKGVPADPQNPIAHNGKDGWQVYEGGTSGAESIIAMGQGFGVVMADNTSDKTFTIPKSSKTHNSGTFNKKSNSESNSFVLNAVSNNVIDNIKLKFNERASSNYDVEYDAYKLKSFGTSPTPYFVSEDGVKLAISEMPFSETVNLGFSMAESGEVTFSINDYNGFSEVVLEDIENARFTNLLKESYSFNYSTDESETGRFKLHFKQETLAEIDYLSEIGIYSNKGSIYLKSNKKLNDVNVEIYSITGQKVFSDKYSDFTNKEIQTSLKGVYILKLNSNECVTTSKIHLK